MSDEQGERVEYLHCRGCEANPTFALIDKTEKLVCHCTHADGEIDPYTVYAFDLMPDRWEFVSGGGDHE